MGGMGSHANYIAWAASAQQPAALIYGDADRITPLLPNSGLLMRQLANAELRVVPGASHQVMQEKPEQVNAAIIEYLNKLS